MKGRKKFSIGILEYIQYKQYTKRKEELFLIPFPPLQKKEEDHSPQVNLYLQYISMCTISFCSEQRFSFGHLDLFDN